MSRLATAACAAAACFALAPTPSVVAEKPTLVGALTGSTEPTFGTLAAALGAAGLVDTFDDPTAGPFTVFAPTDEAFATTLGALGIAPEALLADVPTLTSILTNHVVEGAFKAEDLVPLAPTTVTTLAGFPLVFDVMEGGGATIGGIEILATDVEASNGIAHVIGGILIPPSPVAVADSPLPASEEGEGEEGEGEEGAVPEEEGSSEGEEGAVPEEEGSSEGEEGAVPEEEGSSEGEEGAVPEEEGATPVEEGASEGEEGAVPEEEGATPAEEGATE